MDRRKPRWSAEHFAQARKSDSFLGTVYTLPSDPFRDEIISFLARQAEWNDAWDSFMSIFPAEVEPVLGQMGEIRALTGPRGCCRGIPGLKPAKIGIGNPGTRDYKHIHGWRFDAKTPEGAILAERARRFAQRRMEPTLGKQILGKLLGEGVSGVSGVARSLNSKLLLLVFRDGPKVDKAISDIGGTLDEDFERCSMIDFMRYTEAVGPDVLEERMTPCP